MNNTNFLRAVGTHLVAAAIGAAITAGTSYWYCETLSHENLVLRAENALIRAEILKARGVLLKTSSTLIRVQEQHEQEKKDAEKLGREIEVSLSAYNAVKRQTDSTPNKNALMQRPKPGLSVAVSRDLSHLLGATVYLPGIGVRQVDDLMADRFERSVDVLMPTIKEAKEFGRRDVKMVVVTKKG